MVIHTQIRNYMLDPDNEGCLCEFQCLFPVQCDAFDGEDVSFETLVSLPSSQEGFITYSAPLGGPYISYLQCIPDTFQTV